MSSKMLIDASHPEETRVVVLKGNRVEEFDFEAANKKQLRGNIYLAKVTRVEPSLQAAFVEYGGNRHGFLAFSEIHPDYYQIPFADRQALLEEEARAHRDEDDDSRGNERAERGARGGERSERGGERSDRGDKNDRGDRGDRNHRRSRRHRRDGAVSAMERRGPADDSVSEPAFDAAEPPPPLEELRSESANTATSPDVEDAPVANEAAPDLQGGSEDEPAYSGADPFQPDLGLTGADEPLPEPHDVAESSSMVASHVSADMDAATQEEIGSDAGPSEDQAEFQLEPATDQQSGLEATSDGEPVEVGETADASSAQPEAFSFETVDEAMDSVSPDSMAPEAAFLSDDAGSRDVQAREREADEPRAMEHEDEVVEQIGGDALEDVAPRPTRLPSPL